MGHLLQGTLTCQHLVGNPPLKKKKKKPTMADKVIVINSKAHFEDELKKAEVKLVVVDFFATWCGPCKMIAPKLKAWSTGDHADVVFFKVDVDDNEELSQEKDIKAMPTFHFYKNGEKIDELVGANPEKLEEMIKKNK